MRRIGTTALLLAICTTGFLGSGCGGGGGTPPPIIGTPITLAITRVDPTPTTTTSVNFDLLFSDPALNVDPTDFVVVTTGSASADAAVVVGDAGDADDATYTVTVNNSLPQGAIGLDLSPTTDILSATSAPVAQTPTVDEVYDVIDDVHGMLSLPARTPGNVTAALSGPDLIITPDGGDNSISVTANAAGDVVVAGVGGTTINGLAEFVAFSAVGGVLPGALTVDSSAGRDLISVADVIVTGTTMLLGGSDQDAIDVTNVNAFGNFQADELGGDGFIDLDMCTIGGVGEISTGDGNNAVTVTSSNFLDALSLTGGPEVDQFSLNTVSVGLGTTINTLSGNDIITLATTDHLGTLNLDTGPGGDVLQGSDVDVTAMISLNANSGDDIVDFDDLHAMSTSIVDGGADNDSIRLLNSQFDDDTDVPTTAGNNVIDVQGTTFSSTLTMQASAGAVGVRIKNSTFNIASLQGGPGATDAFLDNGTSTFGAAPTFSGFEDLTNTHIDALFANLLGLVFP